jgi:hypothetical protein
MRKNTVVLGLLLFAAASSRSDIYFDRFDRAPEFRPFEGFEWILLGQLPDNAAPPHADKVLTMARTAPDVNKDGFVTDSGSGPADLIGPADPMGYEALHSASLWGNVRVILNVPITPRADSDMPAPEVDVVFPIPTAASTAPVPEPASLSLLFAGAACTLRRRRK